MLFLQPDKILHLEAAITPTYRTLVLFAAYTGLRAGKIGALRVGRLDLLRGTAQVRESLADLKGTLVFGPTKTYAHRTARLPRFPCDSLGEHLAGRPRRPDDLVFTGPTGATPAAQPLLRPPLQACGPPSGPSGGAALHDLRHTCAALLIAQGGHPKAIMERLGHSSIQVTLDRYGHMLPGLDEALTDGLEHTYRASLSSPAGVADAAVLPRR